jgi:hypothetical protein
MNRFFQRKNLQEHVQIRWWSKLRHYESDFASEISESNIISFRNDVNRLCVIHLFKILLHIINDYSAIKLFFVIWRYYTKEQKSSAVTLAFIFNLN